MSDTFAYSAPYQKSFLRFASPHLKIKKKKNQTDKSNGKIKTADEKMDEGKMEDEKINEMKIEEMMDEKNEG